MDHAMAWTMVSWCDRETYMSGSCLAVGYVRVDPPHQIVVQIVIPISVFAGWERVARQEICGWVRVAQPQQSNRSSDQSIIRCLVICIGPWAWCVHEDCEYGFIIMSRGRGGRTIRLWVPVQE